MEHSLQNIQVQKMMPQTMHSLQLLSMPLFSLKIYLGNIVLDNPYLEPYCDAMELPLSLFAPRDEAVRDDSGGGSEAVRPRSGPGSGPLEFQEHLFAREECSLYEHLRFQAELCSFSAVEAAVARYLISNISSAGYLEESLERVAAVTGCSYALAERVLNVIQTFSPCGVGARSLSECLKLQVDAGTEDFGVLMRILQEDLESLADRKFSFLERKYKISRPRIQKILDYVQILDPRPGGRFSEERFTPYILVDATINLFGPQPEIEVKGDASSLLSFNPNYMKDVTDAEASEFLKQKKLEAIGLMGSLTMRHRTLRLLVSYIADRQRAFFTHGPEALRPMTQKKVAADIGMNPSTVCRCIHEKYIGTPWGTFPLHYFFSSSINDGDYPTELARSAVGALIAGEDKTAPLSDLDIAGALSKKGIQVSRRTVAKYRAQLGLGGQSARIRYI